MTKTPDQINQELMATAATYNAQNPTTDNEGDAAAVAAAHALNQATGSVGHDGKTEVRADTAEEAAAAASKAAEETAKEEKEAAEKARKEALENDTPEEKAEREATEAEAAKKSAEEEEAAKKKAAEAEWITTDNKQFNAALNLMKSSGMTAAEASEIFDEAAQVGDLSKVDTKALIEKVGEDQAALIMAGFTNYVETEGQAILERVQKVHDAVGGTENFSTMSKWARTKAAGDEDFKAKIMSITEMMNSGNEFQADLASKEFLNLYNADSSNSSITTTPGIKVTATPTAPAVPTVDALTARQFAEKSDDAMRNLRGAEQAAALKALSAGRAAGRKKGI